MPRISTIELFKEDMHFSAGHFTILSPEVRENLHGHNYQVYAAFTTIIEDEGLSFDYRFYTDKVNAICESLNQIMLIPGNCKHLQIEEKTDTFLLTFNAEKIIFAKRDVKILPISNVTVEELSNWILLQLIVDQEELKNNRMQKVEVKVFSGPGKSGSAVWEKSI